MFTAIALCFVLVIVSVIVVESAKDTNPVTCGSVIKLQHKETVSTYFSGSHRKHTPYMLMVTSRGTTCILMVLLGVLAVDSSQ
jgi:hypothetical protein